MFGRKKLTIGGQLVSIESMRDEIDAIYNRLDKLESPPEELRMVSCAVCGCLIWKHGSNCGKGEIKQRLKRHTGLLNWSETEDYIHYPYYCKIHNLKPKVVYKPRAKKKMTTKRGE